MTSKRHAPPKRDRSQHDNAAHVKRDAELWLEFFMEASTALISSREPKTDEDFTVIAQDAETFADKALAAKEAKWPGIKL